MEIQLQFWAFRKKAQNFTDKKTGYGLKEPGSNKDLRTSLALLFPSLSPVFIFSFPFFFLLSLRGKVLSLWRILLTHSHFLQFCPIGFIWLTLPLNSPLLAYFPFYKMFPQHYPCWSLVTTPLHSHTSGKRSWWTSFTHFLLFRFSFFFSYRFCVIIYILFCTLIYQYIASSFFIDQHMYIP